jgi:CBS domain-containing protein
MDLKKIGRLRVVSVLSEASLEDASRAMRENHVGDVVVIEVRGGRKVPVGMLTDRDIVMATVALGAPTNALAVGDIMTTDLVLVDASASLTHVIELMKERGVKRIPLIGENKDLVGIISLEDVTRFLARELSALAEVATRQKEVEVQRRRKFA